MFSNLDDILRRGDVLSGLYPGLSASLLVEFYLDYLVHQDELKNESYDGLWMTMREGLRVPDHPDFRFLAQPGIRDVDFVIGYQTYLNALENKNQGDMSGYARYLSVSLRHLSIHAHQTCLCEMLARPAADLLAIGKVLSSWLPVAHSHRIPGYLMMAWAYLDLAKRQTINTGYVSLAYSYVQLAKLSEKQSGSSLENAYFGLGLSLSNPHGLESLDEMLIYCTALARPRLKDNQLLQAGLYAKQVFDSL